MFENELETIDSDIGSQTIVVRRANTRFAPTLVSDICWVSVFFEAIFSPNLYIRPYEISQLSDNPQRFIITDKNKPVAVLHDIHSYERIQESISLLKIIAQSNQSFKNGNYNLFQNRLEIK